MFGPSSLLAQAAIGAALIAAVLAASSVRSQDAGAITIRASFDIISERLGPGSPGPVPRHNEVTLRLSGRNAIDETWDNRVGSVQRRNETRRVLGGGGERGGSWRVAGPNSLLKTTNFPQNVTLIRITTQGRSCTLSVEYRLKPGFREFVFPGLGRGQLATYREPRIVGTSCKIEG